MGALLLSCAALSSATPCRFIPALSLITLSARTSTLEGIVKPICLAAFRLMMNSNFFGCSRVRAMIEFASSRLIALPAFPRSWLFCD